jgi:aminoglycoside phosphotransferase family enzyme
MLSALLRNDSVDSECLSAIATKLAAFHARAPSAKAAIYGSPQTIAANLRENFRTTRPFVDHTISGPSFKTIKGYSEAFQKEHAALLAGRVAQGRVCEGHGDLRAEHICLVDEIEIFDCVEFDAALRYGDIASDIAFLAMDLDFFGCAHLSRQFESAYAAAARDPAMATLLPFYKCYRACVRGKVESLKSKGARNFLRRSPTRVSAGVALLLSGDPLYRKSAKADPANRLRPDRDGKIDRGRVGFPI